MAETNRFQLVVAKENQPGVGIATGTLFSAANATIVPTTPPQMSVAPELIRREAVRPSLTPLTPLVGVTDVTFTFSFEVAGTTDSGGIPDWSILFEACGWRRVPLVSYTVGTIATGVPAAFYHGETITTGGDTGTVIMDTFNGQTTLYVAEETGTLAGATVGGTSLSTATLSARTASVGHSWIPASTPESTVTIGSTSGGPIPVGTVLIGGTSGARIVTTEAWTDGTGRAFRYLSGTLTYTGETLADAGATYSTAITTSTETQTKFPTLTMSVVEDSVRRVIVGCRGKVTLTASEVGGPMIAQCEFKGRVAATPEIDGVAVPGVTRTNQVPPGFRGVTFLVGGDSDAYADEHTPRVQSFGVTIDGNIGVSKDATSSSGLSGEAKIRTRTATANMLIGVQAEGLFDWLAKTRSATPIRVNCVMPSTQTFNSFWYHLPSFTPTSSPGQDDNGDALRNVQGEISGRFPNGGEGDDRELVVSVFSASPV